MNPTILRTLSTAGLTALGIALFSVQPRDRYGSDGPGSTSLKALDGSARQDLAIAIQIELKLLGFYPGPIDGNIGAQTRTAICAYRQWSGESDDSAEALLLALRRRP
ncbi:peptidoglycan-binding domain-containing protein [Holophaga foetida]|uniref:peptidoglycan-binding domain-containing protein n=1 Tax=Holophaga foetida TaxID=35839 RepID=UPI0002472AF7|nr:peptidoglycan-binding domain-containing protein [Holophaga foetida]